MIDVRISTSPGPFVLRHGESAFWLFSEDRGATTWVTKKEQAQHWGELGRLIDFIARNRAWLPDEIVIESV